MLMIIPVVFMLALICLLGLWFFEKVPPVLFLPLALIIPFAIPISASIAGEHTHSNISYTDETGHHTYKNIHGYLTEITAYIGSLIQKVRTT